MLLIPSRTGKGPSAAVACPWLSRVSIAKNPVATRILIATHQAGYQSAKKEANDTGACVLFVLP
jgi:hypothetical protein